jgi:hypothetical protein
VRGKQKDEAVEAMTRALEIAAQDGADHLEAQWRADGANRRRLSVNAAYGLEEVYNRLRADFEPVGETLASDTASEPDSDADASGVDPEGPRDITPEERLYGDLCESLWACKTPEAVRAWDLQLTKDKLDALGDDYRDRLRGERSAQMRVAKEAGHDAQA